MLALTEQPNTVLRLRYYNPTVVIIYQPNFIGERFKP